VLFLLSSKQAIFANISSLRLTAACQIRTKVRTKDSFIIKIFPLKVKWNFEETWQYTAVVFFLYIFLSLNQVLESRSLASSKTPILNNNSLIGSQQLLCSYPYFLRKTRYLLYSAFSSHHCFVQDHKEWQRLQR
jgi:hypothetical protein